MTDLDALRALVAKATPGPLVQSGRAMLLPSGDMLAMFNLAMNVDECHANVALAVAAVNALPALLDELAAARRDAERYRWLRGDAPEHSERWMRWCLQRWDGKCWHSLERAALDAAIDAHLKGKP